MYGNGEWGGALAGQCQDVHSSSVVFLSATDTKNSTKHIGHELKASLIEKRICLLRVPTPQPFSLQIVKSTGTIGVNCVCCRVTSEFMACTMSARNTARPSMLLHVSNSFSNSSLLRMAWPPINIRSTLLHTQIRCAYDSRVNNDAKPRYYERN